jgi:16S rRNA (cytidine1402-2'-O)-methyltransferase
MNGTSSSKPGTLYLVPNTLDFGIDENTALPDIQDTIAIGSLRVAASLTHWVVENAKTTRAFLKRVGTVIPLPQPLQALDIRELPRTPKGGKAVPPADMAALLAPALQGLHVGLISEAGLPAVADPGANLVAAAHAHGVPVRALSGPSSLLLALAASGLNGQSFAFVGYLPVDAAARAARVRELEALSRRQGQTQLVIETPYRNTALLAALLDVLAAGTRVSVSCGLTLPEGWTRTDTVAGWRTGTTRLPDRIPAVFCLLAA